MVHKPDDDIRSVDSLYAKDGDPVKVTPRHSQ